MSTPYHAKYFAYELTRRHSRDGVDRLSSALFDASVDLNPHQIDAALFALGSPLSKGVLLADEVGLGKTIEAGLVLCQYWAERRRRLLVICPASLRKQWSMELEEKFNLPTLIMDATAYRRAKADGDPAPFDSDEHVIIMSLHFASAHRDQLRLVPFDLVVIDEAHKLRNAYRPSNKMGQNIRWALSDRKKLLLTATPLQNSLLELFGLSTLIDETIFGDITSFRAQYMHAGADYNTLRERLEPFSQRTLRRQVLEYVRYTERHPLTVSFRPTDVEQRLYDEVSDYLMREESIALPAQQRHLMVLVLRKLLASSTPAISDTLKGIRRRLQQMRDNLPDDDDDEANVREMEWDDIIGSDWLDELLADTAVDESAAAAELPLSVNLDAEIRHLDRLIALADGIQVDAKAQALLKALNAGFSRMKTMGANRKAVIFTESRRTQEYLKNFLEANGYRGDLVLFSGTNTDPDSRQIITDWLDANEQTGRRTGSRPVDSRTALIEHFRDDASIMIATEAAAEGINLQFCSLVINYDLPWNPQRIEQRIGRCHRYGQKHDVVVINFLNERNAADQRVYELLAQKFHLFDGVFGASDEVIGSLESGVDLERRIFAIYQQCRTEAEIEDAFTRLQQEMEASISSRMADTRRLLMEHFDEDVHARLRVQLDDAQASLDRTGRMFWSLTRHVLAERAQFDNEQFVFQLHQPPEPRYIPGRYRLISKSSPSIADGFVYRLSHPLGEWVIAQGQAADVPSAVVRFDVTNYPRRLSVVESLKGESGWLTLQRLVIDSYGREEYLLFTGFTDDGQSLDQEVAERMFYCDATVAPAEPPDTDTGQRLRAASRRHLDATVARSLEYNSALFNEERERLERWADDMMLAAERQLTDTKVQLQRLRREARLAVTLEEQEEIQMQTRSLERKQRQQRQNIFRVEDEIADRRDDLIDALQQRMQQNVTAETLFTVRWEVV